MAVPVGFEPKIHTRAAAIWLNLTVIVVHLTALEHRSTRRNTFRPWGFRGGCKVGAFGSAGRPAFPCEASRVPGLRLGVALTLSHGKAEGSERKTLDNLLDVSGEFQQRR